MINRIVLSGPVDAPGTDLSPFTPEGERSWVGPDWDPTYPAGAATLEPGLVFLAAGAVWVVADVEPDRLRYARVTPGERAGLVDVRRRDGGAVDVTYDLTALNGDAVPELQVFADGFPAMLRHWSRAVAAAGTRVT